MNQMPRVGRMLVLALLPPLLAACPGGENNWDEVTLRPGKTAYCDNAPCRVHFTLPRGRGKYVVSAVGYGRLGEYPAGETVFLGSFWEGRYEFNVEGSGAAPAYLWIRGGG